jgi:ankyrin repeat protein
MAMNSLLSEDVLLIIFNDLPDIRAYALVCKFWHATTTKHVDHKFWQKKDPQENDRIYVLKYGSAKMTPLISLPIQQYDIILAASCGNMAMISHIADNLSNINYISEALITACGGGHLEAVKRLVELNGDPTVHDNRPIKRAGEWGHLNVVKYLITVNADIHAEDDILLNNACQRGHFELVKFLISANVNVDTNNGGPLIYASGNGHLVISKYLLDQGASQSISNYYAIRVTCGAGCLDCVKLLVVERGNIYAAENDALLRAIEWKRTDVVEYLLSIMKQ